MELQLIYDGLATVEDLQELNEKKGFEFVVENGGDNKCHSQITQS